MTSQPVPESSSKLKVAILTNEIGVIAFGGVATWCEHVMKMFEASQEVELVIVFSPFAADSHPDFKHIWRSAWFQSEYKGMRFLRTLTEDSCCECFSGVDICLNSTWDESATIESIRVCLPAMKIVTVCHSLIAMEELTNGGPVTSDNLCELLAEVDDIAADAPPASARGYGSGFGSGGAAMQLHVFALSDFVVLISRSELEAFEAFGYDKVCARYGVIYNPYAPKYDDAIEAAEAFFEARRQHPQRSLESFAEDEKWKIALYKKVQEVIARDYSSCNPGFLGRHVERKRPETALYATQEAMDKGWWKDVASISVFNMGMDRSWASYQYWHVQQRKFGKLSQQIDFSTKESDKNYFWSNIGVLGVTGVYEPFGYTVCEALDRLVPVIVQDVGGPREITELVKDSVISYHVHWNGSQGPTAPIERDYDSFAAALRIFWSQEPEERRSNARMARRALDRLRPAVVMKDWMRLLRHVSTMRCERSLVERWNVYRQRLHGNACKQPLQDPAHTVEKVLHEKPLQDQTPIVEKASHDKTPPAANSARSSCFAGVVGRLEKPLQDQAPIVEKASHDITPPAAHSARSSCFAGVVGRLC